MKVKNIEDVDVVEFVKTFKKNYEKSEKEFDKAVKSLKSKGLIENV